MRTRTHKCTNTQLHTCTNAQMHSHAQVALTCTCARAHTRSLARSLACTLALARTGTGLAKVTGAINARATAIVTVRVYTCRCTCLHTRRCTHSSPCLWRLSMHHAPCVCLYPCLYAGCTGAIAYTVSVGAVSLVLLVVLPGTQHTRSRTRMHTCLRAPPHAYLYIHACIYTSLIARKVLLLVMKFGAGGATEPVKTVILVLLGVWLLCHDN